MGRDEGLFVGCALLGVTQARFTRVSLWPVGHTQANFAANRVSTLISPPSWIPNLAVRVKDGTSVWKHLISPPQEERSGQLWLLSSQIGSQLIYWQQSRWLSLLLASLGAPFLPSPGGRHSHACGMGLMNSGARNKSDPSAKQFARNLPAPLAHQLSWQPRFAWQRENNGRFWQCHCPCWHRGGSPASGNEEWIARSLSTHPLPLHILLHCVYLIKV